MLGELLSSVYIDNVFYVLLLNVAVFIGLLFRMREELLEIFSDMDRKWLFISIGISLLFILLPLYYHHLGNRQIFVHLVMAQDFIRPETVFYNRPQYGPFIPFLMSIWLLLGLGYNSIFYLLILVFFLSSALLFFLVYLLFENKPAAIFSVILFGFFNHYSIFNDAYTRGSVEVAQFAFILSILMMFLAYRIDNKETYLLALLSIGFFGMVKFEFMMLLPVFLLGITIYRKREIYSPQKFLGFFKKKLISPLAVFFFLGFLTYIIPVVIHLNCWGTPEHCTPFSIRNAFLQNIFSLSEGGSFFSTSLLTQNLDRLVNHWLISPFSYLLILTGMGVTSLKDKKKSFVLISMYIFMVIPYLFSSKGYQPRYQLYAFIPLAILSGLAPVSLTLKLERYIEKLDRKVIASLVAILLLIPFLSIYPSLMEEATHKSRDIYIEPSLVETLERVDCPTEKCSILVPNYFTKKNSEVVKGRPIISIENVAKKWSNGTLNLSGFAVYLRDNPSQVTSTFGFKREVYLLGEENIRGHQGENIDSYHRIIKLLKDRHNPKKIYEKGDFTLYRFNITKKRIKKR